MLALGTGASEYFQYLLAVAATRFEIKIHAFVLMSNHYHIVLTDQYGQYPAFAGWLNSMVARTVNAANGRKDVFWDGHQVNVVDLLDADAVARKIAYVLNNPNRAGAAPSSMLSACFLDLPQAPSRLKAYRPKIFGSRRKAWPELVELEMHPPTEGPLFGYTGDLTAMVTHYLRQDTGTVATSSKHSANTEVGAIVGPWKRPPVTLSLEARSRSRPAPTTIPRAASSDPLAVGDYLTMIRRFERLHRDARASYLEHNKDTGFPEGTYLPFRRSTSAGGFPPM